MNKVSIATILCLLNITYAAQTFDVCRQPSSDWASIAIADPDMTDCMRLTYDDIRSRVQLKDKTDIMLDSDQVVVYVPNQGPTVYDTKDLYWTSRIVNFLKHYSTYHDFNGCMRYSVDGHKKRCRLPLLGDSFISIEQQKHLLPFIKVSANEAYGVQESIYYFSQPKTVTNNTLVWQKSWQDGMITNDMTKRGIKHDK